MFQAILAAPPRDATIKKALLYSAEYAEGKRKFKGWMGPVIMRQVAGFIF